MFTADYSQENIIYSTSPYHTVSLQSLLRHSRGRLNICPYGSLALCHLLSSYMDYTAFYADWSSVQSSIVCGFVRESQVVPYVCLVRWATSSLFRLEPVLFRSLLRPLLPCSLRVYACTPYHLVTVKILQVSRLHKAGMSVISCWLSGRVFLPGIDAADEAPKDVDLRAYLVCDRSLDNDVHATLLWINV
jgi:hypothetical protein